MAIAPEPGDRVWSKCSGPMMQVKMPGRGHVDVAGNGSTTASAERWNSSDEALTAGALAF